MDRNRDIKRRKDRNSDSDDNRKEKESKRHRSRSRSPNERDSRRKRRRSRSKSPNVLAKQEKLRHDAPQDGATKSEAPQRKAKDTDMLNTRTGGAYIPPARLRLMQAQITDKSSVAYQRLAWEALKKSIHGHINKINVGNIGIIIKELLKENIVRGRGLLCRSIIQAQAASPTFTNVYAALVAAVNSRFPNIGELLLKRLVIQFKRGFKRNDKPTCIASASFIAHLVNQRVAHEILALELLTLLVETPTDDSVEVSIAFLKECGQKLTEVSSKGVNAIFEMLRNILHEGQLDKRVQYMIEVMFQVWKDGFKDHPAVIEELELVPEEEQFTHLLMLDDATDAQDILNVFKFDDKYEENEGKYKDLCKEILGSDAESGEEGSDGSGSEESDEEEEDKQKEVTIIDNTETNLVALRRTIYLTINSSLDFEECAHKLMRMQLKPGQEIELCHMFLDCCAEQRTYEKFYGLLAQRFCNINRIYIGPFEEIFKDSYSTAHRLDTNRLRNVSKFFAHLLFTDSISWEVLECVKLNEEDTTSSSRIYIKILFQELAEYMGLKKLNDRLQDPTLQGAFSGIFPRDNPKNTRFSINFFTSIGLGGLTDALREHLKQMPKNVPAPITEIKLDSDSSSDSSSSSESSSSSDDSSSSDSDEEKRKKEKKKKKTNSSNSQTTQEPHEANKAADNVERWGHDGFYDTYGKDARRVDSRSNDTNRNTDRVDNRNNDERRRNNYNYEQRHRNDFNNKDTREERRGRTPDPSKRDVDNYSRDKRHPEQNRRKDEDRDRRQRNERDREERVDRAHERDDNFKKDREVRRDDEELSRSQRDREQPDRNRRYHDDDRKDRDNYEEDKRRYNKDKPARDERVNNNREYDTQRRDERRDDDTFSRSKRDTRDNDRDKRYRENDKRNVDDDRSRIRSNRDQNSRGERRDKEEVRKDHDDRTDYEYSRRERDADRRTVRGEEERVDRYGGDRNRNNKNSGCRDSDEEISKSTKTRSRDDKKCNKDNDSSDDSREKEEKYERYYMEKTKEKENIQEGSDSEVEIAKKMDKKEKRRSSPHKKSKREKKKKNKKHSRDSDSDSGLDAGGRYWDNFDIDSKKSSLAKVKQKVR